MTDELTPYRAGTERDELLHPEVDAVREGETGPEDDLPAGRGVEPGARPEKDPSDWVTGHEPMTGPQRSYLETLSREAGEPFDERLSKAEASERIEELQRRTGRGVASDDRPGDR